MNTQWAYLLVEDFLYDGMHHSWPHAILEIPQCLVYNHVLDTDVRWKPGSTMMGHSEKREDD